MIVKLGEQKRISLRCLNCSYFGFMNIRGKTKVKKRINYYVSCPKCGQNFKQVGRPYNFWRDVKKKYKLSHKELRVMSRELMRKIIKDGIAIAKEDSHNRLEIGDIVFIKREGDDLKSIRPCRFNDNNLSN